ncbi:MAG: T9SS type A sorting domain-containing protein, partial [Bacteroidota bacterium]
IPPQDQWANNNGKWGSDAITSIENIEGGDVMIYPNPFQSYVTIEGKDIRGKKDLYLRDINGRLLRSWKEFELPSDLEVGQLSPGFYSLEIIDSRRKERFTVKLIKK